MTAVSSGARGSFKQAIAKLSADSIEAFNRGDAKACAGFYTEDAILFIPDSPPIEGRQAIEAVLAQYMTVGSKVASINTVWFGADGDMGFCAGAYQFDFPAKDGSTVTETGKFVTVLRREADGSWKAMVDSLIRDRESQEPNLSSKRCGEGGLHGAEPAKRPIMGGNDYLTQDEVLKAYQKWAKVYDLATYCYYLVGMRIGYWRRLVIEAMALRPGDTVIEIGCGTGLNFSLLQQAVGKEGRIIGVDISEAMLEIARKRVGTAGWQNVELVCQAAADYRFPEQVGGIFATGVLNYEPDFDKVIARGTKALAPGRRWVVLDYKMPKNWLRYLAPLFIALGSAYGVSRAFMERRVWKSVQHRLRNTQMRELYGGFVYIVSGEAP